MKNKVLKIGLWVVGVIFVMLTILYILGTYRLQIENYFETQRYEKMMAKYEKEKAEILEMQKNDTYGGKTPEETLDLYIQALKAGDIELASKYYEISLENASLREKKLGALKKDLDDKLIDLSIKNLNLILDLGYRKFINDNEYVITYKYFTEDNSTSTMVSGATEYVWLVPAGSEESFSKAFRLNPYTKVWKIIQ